MPRLLLLTLISLGCLPAVALAAAKPGSYSGKSSAKYVRVGLATEPTDTGKVTFTVRRNKVRNFRLKGQQMNCGPAPVVPVTVETIKLNSAGRGSALYKNPNIGTLKVRIRVTSAGKASGTIRRPTSAVGLCNPDYPVRFTAKRT
jgi:hypothetical protein